MPRRRRGVLGRPPFEVRERLRDQALVPGTRPRQQVRQADHHDDPRGGRVLPGDDRLPNRDAGDRHG